jgi:hypothetical protein
LRCERCQRSAREVRNPVETRSVGEHAALPGSHGSSGAALTLHVRWIRHCGVHDPGWSMTAYPPSLRARSRGGVGAVAAALLDADGGAEANAGAITWTTEALLLVAFAVASACGRGSRQPLNEHSVHSMQSQHPQGETTWRQASAYSLLWTTKGVQSRRLSAAGRARQQNQALPVFSGPIRS